MVRLGHGADILEELQYSVASRFPAGVCEVLLED